VIVFVADHGEEFHEHGGWWHGESLYEEQIAVPIMVKLPDKRMAGLENVNFARLMDVAPTILELAGLPAPTAMQGSKLIELTKDAYGNDKVDFVYSHLDFEGIVLRAARTMTEKLIESNAGNKRHYAPVELYDLHADPGETTNLAGKKPDSEKTLMDLIDEMLKVVTGAAVAPQLNQNDQELKQQLENLGYVH
jgi:iduronate 2-sulfatase